MYAGIVELRMIMKASCLPNVYTVIESLNSEHTPTDNNQSCCANTQPQAYTLSATVILCMIVYTDTNSYSDL